MAKSEGSDSRAKLTRREGLVLAASAAGMGLSDLAEALQRTDESLYGGIAALTQAYNVSGDLWVGPNSAKSGVTASSGRLYIASDTEEIYYGDSGSWVSLNISSGALTDSGSNNADGGDQYQLPAAEDSIDLQGTGDIENADTLAGTQVDVGAVSLTESSGALDIGASGDDGVTMTEVSGTPTNPAAGDRLLYPSASENAWVDRDENGTETVLESREWTRDGTLNVTGAQTATYTMNTTYDRVRVKVEGFSNQSGVAQELMIRINGLSSGYSIERGDDTSGAAKNAWNLQDGGTFADGSGASGSFLVYPAPQGGVYFDNRLTYIAGTTLAGGSNTGASTPITQFTLRGSSGNITAQAVVYGQDNEVA